jgi:Domain of unknown function (DUF4124)
MVFELSTASRCLIRAATVLAGLNLSTATSSAATPADGNKSAAGIYTCTDDRGRRLTSDRPIPDCLTKEQRVLNSDGSQRTVLPPTPTAEERAEREVREREAAQRRIDQADAVRRDRNMVARYPDEAAHQKAREASLDTVRVAIKATEQRLLDLAAERKPLTNEAEFYQGRVMPAKLKAQIDANDAAREAQRSAVTNQQAELARINSLYDAELVRMRKLWSGAPPGSLGPLVGAAHAPAGAASSPKAYKPRRVARQQPPAAETPDNRRSAERPAP